MLQNGQALELTKSFCHAYMAARDMEGAVALADEEVFFRGTAAYERGYGLEELREYLRQDLAENPGGFALRFDREQERPLAEGCAVADMQVELTGPLFRMQVEVSAVVRETGAGPRISYIRYSVPTALQQEGEHYPLALVEENIARMKSELLDRSAAGGIMGGYAQPGYPFYCINETMLRYLGYTDETEFKADNQGLLSRCVHPDDRAEMERALKRQVRQHGEYVVEHRMRKRDGSYIWVHNVGRSITAEDGRPAVISVCMDITTLKETERKLEESRRRYELAVEGAGLWVWEYNIPKHQIYQSLPTPGFRGQDAVVEDVPEVLIRSGAVREDCIEAFREMYRRLEAGESRVSGEFWFRRPGAETDRCERITYVAVPSEDGRPAMAYGASIDITGRKEVERQYEKELRYREEVISTLRSSYRVNLTRQVVEEQYDQGKVRRNVPYNEAFRRKLARYVTDAEMEEELYRLMSPESLIAAYGRGQRTFQREYPIHRGSDGWLVTTINLMQQPDSDDLLAFFYSKDITREKLLQSAVDTILAMEYEFILLVDTETGRYHNVAVRPSVDGLPEDQNESFDRAMEAHLHRCVITDRLEEVAQAVRLEEALRHLESQDIYSVDCDIREIEGGVRRKQLQFTRAYQDQRHLVVTRKDVEELVREEKQKQEALRAALRAAQEANNAKSEFMARMSHDMRTPMNGVIGLARLGRELTTLKEAREYFAKINESGEYLLLLINDTLEMNRIESGYLELHPEPMSSYALFQEIVAINRYAAQERQLDFVSEYQMEGDHWIQADRERTMQVFNNLLSNAIKFTPRGGRVEFLCQCAGAAEDGRLLVRALVRDTGIGIAETFLPRLFQPFEQENDSTVGENMGSGLGLSIVKSLVELMGGEISVESRKGQGTEFRVCLAFPPAEPPAGAAEDQSPPAERDLTGRRILVCEDHPLNAQIAQALLERRGIRVELAENGQAGVARFAASAPGEIDAILMDIRMPVMDGLEAARAIRGLDRPDAGTVPIIAMTANAFAADREKSLEAGMSDHLTKPVDPVALYGALQHWIH